MSAAIDIGTLQGTLAMRNAYSAEFDKFNRQVNEKLAKSVKGFYIATEKDTQKIKTAFDRVSAALDPTIANTNKYKQAQLTLQNALKSGIITQEEYNRQLDLAKDKYLSTTTAQKTFAKSLEHTGAQLSQVGTALTLGVSGPLAIVTGLAVNSGRAFETSFAGVRKTVDGTAEELAKLSQGLRDMAAGPDPIPIDVNKLNEVAESAGQLGIARDDILAFTRTMADLGETTNLTALQASESIAQFQNIFGAAGVDVDRFGSTLVALGNAGASTEKAILEMGVRIAGAGKQIDLTQGQVLAIASSLSSVDIEAEAGGSAISKVMVNMALAVENGGKELSNFASVAGTSSDKFKAAFQTDAARALELFISGLGRMRESGGSALSVLDKMGITEVRMRDALLRAAGAGELLRDNLDLQSKAWEENNALTEEAKKRYETFDSQLQLTRNKLNDVGITLGTALLPVLRDFLDLAKPIISAVASMAENFALLPAPIKAIIVGMGALVIAAGPVLFVSGQLAQSYASILLIAPKVAATFPLIGRAVTALLGPWGLLAAAIAAATLALSAFISKWKSEMQAEIGKMVADANKLGTALDRLRQIRDTKSASSSDIQSMSDELADLSNQIDDYGKRQREQIERSNKKYNDQIAIIKKATGEETTQAKQLARFRDDAANKIRQQNRTELQDLESRKKLLIESLRSVETITDEVKEQTETVSILSNEDEKKINQLRLISQEREIELQRLKDLQALAASGSLDTIARLKGEEKINDLYEYRLSLLRNTEQFGAKIGKQLADQEKSLKDFERKVKIELILAMKLEPLKINVKDAFKFTDESLKEAVKRLDAVIDVEKSNTAAYQQTLTDYEDFIQSSATSWIEHFKSMGEIAEDEIEIVKEAVKLGFMSVSQGEKAIAEIRAEYYSSQIDQWAGFVSSISGMLSELGGSFGKFMSYISQIAGSVQNVNSTAQSLGGWSTAMGAWGGTIAAFVELYKFADSVIQKHKSEKYGTRSGLSITGGSDVYSYTSQESMGLSREIAAVLKAFEDSLRISVRDLQAIEIRVRNNGKDIQAWVKGEWIGTFQDVNEAIRAALAFALSDPDSSLRGMSDLMTQALSRWTSPDMEGLISFLGELRTISDLSLSPLVIDLQKSMLEINRLREALSKLDQSTREVIAAQNELNKAQERLFEQAKAQLLGIDLSMAEGIRNLAGFQKGIADATSTWRQGLESTIQAAENQLAKLERKATGLPTGGGGGQGVSGGKEPTTVDPITARLFSGTTEAIEDEISRLKSAISNWKEELGKVPNALTDLEIDLGIYNVMKDAMQQSGKYAGEVAKFEAILVDKKWQEVKLQLIAIGAWERWAGVWQDLYNQAMVDAGKAPRLGRGSGGGSDKDSVRDFIKDKKFELSLIGLSDYQKSLKELDRTYEDLLKQAGKDNKLKRELLDLKEKERKELVKESAAGTQNKFREFLGLVTPFDKVRKTAADLIKEIEGSPFGNARKAGMIGRVLAEVDKQLTRMSKEMAVGLFGNMLSDMERFGASEEQMLAARRAMAIFEHELKMLDYAASIAMLETQGKVSAETLAILKEQYNFLAGIDPTLFLGPPANDNDEEGGKFSSYSGSNVADSFFDRLKSVQDKLAEWARIPLSETLSRAHELTDSFASLMEDVNKLIPFGWDYTQIAQDTFKKLIRDFVDDTLNEFEESGSELENTLRGIGERFTDINAAFVHLGASQEDLQRAEVARLNAVNQALSQYLDPIRERRNARLVGDRSILTGEQQYFNAQAQFREMFAKIESGDLSGLGDVVSLADQYEELLKSYTGGEGVRFGLKEIDDTLLAIENLVPGFAAEMAEVGTEENPMVIDSEETVSAIHESMEAVNTGNSLLLVELRSSLTEMREQNVTLQNIEWAVSNPLSVKNVA